MTPSTTKMPSPTCSEKLLRDTLLRDERERLQLLSCPPPTRPLVTRRRYSYAPTSSDVARTEYYARGSSLFRTAMGSSRSPSSSSSSEHDRESPVRRRLFYGGDNEAQAQQQQSPPSTSPRTRSSRRDSSTSASPSPLRMKRRQESLEPITANFNPTPPTTTNVTHLRRNQSLHNTPPNRYGSSHGPSEHLAGSGHIVMRARYGNEVRDEQGGWPWKRGRQSIRSGSGSMISESFSTSHSHSSQTPTRTTPNRATTTSNSAYNSPVSPRALRAVSPCSPSFNRTRSQTNTVNPNTPSPRRNNSSPSTLLVLKPTKKLPLPIGEVEEAVRLPTPPPSPRTSQRKKEGGLELRQGPRNRLVRADVTITQQAPRSPTGPRKNTDGHSLSSESCSTRTSVSSVSHLHVGCSCSSHSSLDEPLIVPPPPRVSHDHHQPFNARKASTQCRAIEGYVSFASVEGLGEPPLVRDEYDENGGNGRKGSVPFLPLGVLNAAFGWKKFLGGGDTGVEGPVVV